MIIEVKLFAVAKDLAGADSVSVELADGATVADLRATLTTLCPKLQPIMGHVMIAVGSQYAADDSVISTDSEVACIPPVSGG